MAHQVSVVLITESWKSVAEKISLDLLWSDPCVTSVFAQLKITSLCARDQSMKAKNYFISGTVSLSGAGQDIWLLFSFCSHQLASSLRQLIS